MIIFQQKQYYFKIHPSKKVQIKRQTSYRLTHIAVKAFFPSPEEPAGITLRTLNLTVLESGLQENTEAC